jgi:polysaccharide biosynthesis protein PslH
MTPPRPSILFLSPTWPHGRTFGGQLRALHIARALQVLGDVTVMVVGSEAQDPAGPLLSASEFRVARPVTGSLAPNTGAWQRLRWAFDPRYLNVHGYIIPPEERARVMSSCERHDLIWIMNARTPNLLQIWRWPRSHLDIDDLPSVYLHALARSARPAVHRWKARMEHALMRRREHFLGSRFTTLSVCSDNDRRHVSGDSVHVIPNGFARPAAEPHRVPGQPPRLGFIGLYSYAPNLEGVRWFLDQVWPILRQRIPGIRFRLVGKDTDGALRPDAPDVDALGWLEDPSAEIATWSATVIPIRIGGGTRIKIADAFSRKCPVVSTRFGAYGYNVENSKQLLLADNPEDFANACIRLVNDPIYACTLAENAWTDFLQHWTWDAIAPNVWAAAEDCLRRSAQGARVLPNQ